MVRTSNLDRRSFGRTATKSLVAIGLGTSMKAPRGVAHANRPTAEKIANRLYFLTVEGTPYDRGLQHGKSLRYVIHRGIATWKQWIAEFLEQPNPDVEIAEFVQGTDFLGAIREHTPDLYLELQGIAAGANVNLNDLYAYNMFDEFLSFTVQKYRLGFCSGFGVYGRDDMPNIIGQNNDLPRFFDGTQTLLRIKGDDDRQTYVFTFAGLLANNGLNDSSVGCTINIMPSRLSGELDGLPMPYVVRGILARPTRSEAVEFVKHVGKYAGPMDYIIGDPTGVTVAETGKDHFKLFDSYKGENYVPHTNHPLDMTADMKPGEASKSPERLAKLIELISGRTDRIDVAETRKIFRTRPLLKNYETDPTFPTLESIIIELDADNPRLQIAPGPPDRYKYQMFDFKNGHVGAEE